MQTNLDTRTLQTVDASLFAEGKNANESRHSDRETLYIQYSNFTVLNFLKNFLFVLHYLELLRFISIRENRGAVISLLKLNE